jgi:hypothetical protein
MITPRFDSSFNTFKVHRGEVLGLIDKDHVDVAILRAPSTSGAARTRRDAARAGGTGCIAHCFYHLDARVVITQSGP